MAGDSLSSQTLSVRFLVASRINILYVIEIQYFITVTRQYYTVFILFDTWIYFTTTLLERFMLSYCKLPNKNNYLFHSKLNSRCSITGELKIQNRQLLKGRYVLGNVSCHQTRPFKMYTIKYSKYSTTWLTASITKSCERLN